MTTFVPRPQPRRVTFDSFDDLLPEGVRVLQVRADGVEFSADLDPATTAAIRARLMSTDDADQAARANLRALRDAAATGGLEEVQALTVAAIDYWLGD